MTEIPRDYRFLRQTKEGYDVVEVLQGYNGYLSIVFYRPSAKDYGVARSYDPTRGDWYKGVYCFPTKEQALSELLSGPDAPYTEFNPHDPRDVKFEYDAQYNWNYVNTEYMKAHSHHNDDFNTRPHSRFSSQRNGDYDGNVYSDSDEGYDALKREFRRRNAPQRSLDIKGGKYAERRARFKTLFRLKR